MPRIRSFPPGFARTTLRGTSQMDAGSEAGMTKLEVIPAQAAVGRIGVL
jgi:hypothetical protein